MSSRWIALSLFLMTSPLIAQQPQSAPASPNAAFGLSGDISEHPSILPAEGATAGNEGGFLTGNHNFPNFINFVSDPLQSIDPRAVTAIYPIFGSVWVTNASPIPNGDAQVYGPAITIALSDRLAVGVNQGGLAEANFSRNPIDRQRILRDERLHDLLSVRVAARIDERDFGGDRFGFLNLGGFVQYTLIADVENQFLLTVGTRWEAPAGSHEVFQGYGPAELAPYFTMGKELGDYHVLLTGSYQFPIGPGSDNTNLFYANLHLDRRCFGWLYPLVELNCIYQEKSFDFGLTTRRGFIDFGNVESSGNVVTLAAGANAVIVPERLEFGMVYTTTLATQNGLNVNGLIAKMTIRY
jgi:hypothetical protein